MRMRTILSRLHSKPYSVGPQMSRLLYILILRDYSTVWSLHTTIHLHPRVTGCFSFWSFAFEPIRELPDEDIKPATLCLHCVLCQLCLEIANGRFILNLRVSERHNEGIRMGVLKPFHDEAQLCG